MTTLRTLIFAIAGLFALVSVAHAQSPREQLDQLVQQLQKKPSDNALRKQIIKLAQENKPAPAIPEEARAAFVEGTAIAQGAKDASQQKIAVQSFNEALKRAPWWGDAYYNLAIAQELAGQFDAAQVSLELYILTNPGEKEAREAQDRIYAINAKKKLAQASAVEAKQTKQAEQNSPETAAAREQKILDSMEGMVWKGKTAGDADIGIYLRYCYAVEGHRLRLISSSWHPGEREVPPGQGKEKESTVLTGMRLTYSSEIQDSLCNPVTVQISEDLSTLTVTSSNTMLTGNGGRYCGTSTYTRVSRQ